MNFAQKLSKKTSVRLRVTAMSRGKYKIGVDRNVQNLGQLLKDKGYNAVTYSESGQSDLAIHKDLNKQNVRFFLTADYDDFQEIGNRNYSYW